MCLLSTAWNLHPVLEDNEGAGSQISSCHYRRGGGVCSHVFPMKWLCCYDISESNLRHKVFSFLEKIALPVQKSVFVLDEFNTTRVAAVFKMISQQLKKEDSFYMVPICRDCELQLLYSDNGFPDKEAAVVL